MGQIGRLWHRMYPVVRVVRDRQDPTARPYPLKTSKYLEFLTLFPDHSSESRQFIDFLNSQHNNSNSFQRLY